MIIRIVKMTFIEDKIHEFKKIFKSSCSKIRNSEGCLSLKLLQSAEDQRIIFTVSEWESVRHLELYRASETFKHTWAQTKVLFADKPEAWTTTEIA